MAGIAIEMPVQGRSPPKAVPDQVVVLPRIRFLNGYGHEERSLAIVSMIAELGYDVGRGTDADWVWSKPVPDQHNADLIIWLVCSGCRTKAAEVVGSLCEVMDMPPIVLFDIHTHQATLAAPSPLGDQHFDLQKIDEFIR